MATRSAIGLITDRYIYGIYCHWDGMPMHNGKILVENYASTQKAWDLIGLGNLSALTESIDTCTYYARDMKRDGESYATFNNRDEFLEHFLRMGCEYFYLFEDRKWMLNRISDSWTRYKGWEELSL